eukprot:1206439-Amphidinium_carterae.1
MERSILAISHVSSADMEERSYVMGSVTTIDYGCLVQQLAYAAVTDYSKYHLKLCGVASMMAVAGVSRKGTIHPALGVLCRARCSELAPTKNNGN